MKRTNGLLIAGIGAILVSAYLWFFVYNKAHVDYSEEKASYTGSSAEFNEILSANQADFSEKYTNTAVILEGRVTESATQSFILDDVFLCTVDSTFAAPLPQLGESLKVKGRVVGIEDDILGNVLCRLDQCIRIE